MIKIKYNAPIMGLRISRCSSSNSLIPTESATQALEETKQVETAKDNIPPLPKEVARMYLLKNT